ncbi:MAG: phage tail protein [Kluyvera sp.]|uniref:phage tail-collar fiber domain-containing protein n=1 Tax=Kluyvera sp. TaxID=1538228 RepID=UPI003A857C9D
MSDFKAILTDLGQQLITTAYQAGEVVTVTQMAFGDANQQPVTVDPAMTALIHQTAILPLTRGPQTEDIIGGGIDILSSDYPDSWIYECGLFDDDGNLIIYASYPPALVPPDVDNVKKGVSIDIGLVMSSTDGITVYVDPEIEALTKAVADTLYFKLDQNFAELEDEDHGDEAKAEAREHLGCGTAAVHDVTESSEDTTTDRVLKVGDYNLGLKDITSQSFDFNVYEFISGQRMLVDLANCTNVPADLLASYAANSFPSFVIACTDNNAGYETQVVEIIVVPTWFDTPMLVMNRDNSGNWSSQRFYSTTHKPTAGDVAALPIAGGTMTGRITLSGNSALDFPETTYVNQAIGRTGTYATSTLDYRWELFAISVADQTIRSNIITVDITDISKGASTSGGGTNSTTQITLAAGLHVSYQVVPGDYGNFDSRYIADIQLGAVGQTTTWNQSGHWPNKAGYVLTSVSKDTEDYNIDVVYYAPLQKKTKTGSWVTVAGGV